MVRPMSHTCKEMSGIHISKKEKHSKCMNIINKLQIIRSILMMGLKIHVFNIGCEELNILRYLSHSIS